MDTCGADLGRGDRAVGPNDLRCLLDLEAVGEDTFRGVNRPARLPVFGGQLVGQSLIAAARTVTEDRSVRSLHGYFVRAGDSQLPITYRVSRISDGRLMATRQVTAEQRGMVLFILLISFQVDQSGRADQCIQLDHGSPMPAAADPESLPTLEQRYASHEERIPWLGLPQPVDLRYVDDPPWVPGGASRARNLAWLRVIERLPDEDVLHVAALAFASDMTPLDSVLVAHGAWWGDNGLTGFSLDHAIWFHRPFRADEWLLYEATSPSAVDGRGLAVGRLWTRDGHHAATVAQEGVFEFR